MFWKSSFWKLLLSGFSEAKFVPLSEPLRILFYHIDQFPYSNWSRIIKSPSLLTFDAINIICVCLSHAFVAVSRLSVLVIIFLSIFSRPTLSVMLYSNNGVALLECLLNAALNDVALLVFFKIIPYIFAFQVPFISSEVFYQLVQCSVLDLVPKTTDGLIVNFNWKKEEKKKKLKIIFPRRHKSSVMDQSFQTLFRIIPKLSSSSSKSMPDNRAVNLLQQLSSFSLFELAPTYA